MEWRKIRLTEKEVLGIKNRIEQIENKALIKRLQCILLKDKKWKHQEIMDFLGVSLNSVSDWLKIYKKGGISDLLHWNYEGRVSLLSLEDQKKIKARNREKPFDTGKEAKAYILKEFGVDWHLHSVQKLLKKSFNFRTKKQN